MVQYRQAQKKDSCQCIDLLTLTFNDYDYFTLFTSSEKMKMNFIRRLMTINFNVILDKGIVLVAEEDGRIIAVALLETPEYTEPGTIEYLARGGMGLVFSCGVRNAFGFLNMFDVTNSDCKDFTKNHPAWHLNMLGVLSEKRGTGIGSRFLQDYVIPYIREKDGAYFTLITNAEYNTPFYKKNGFEQFGFETFTIRNFNLGNWSFKMKLQ